MGSRIARRLLTAGHELTVWNRTAEKADDLIAHGAARAGTPAEAATGRAFVLTMVSNPEALRAVTEGDAGVAAGVSATATVLEMSTVGLAAVSRLRAVLPEDVELLDAPVLGSRGEAESGTLRIFVGGSGSGFAQASPLLSELGTPMHVGELGAGAAAKLVANSTLFGVLATLGEALALAETLGLEQDAAFDVLSATPVAAQAERRRESVESGAYPVRFALALARKDADLLADAAASADLELPVAEAARRWLVDAESAGLAEQDYSAVLAQILGRRVSPVEPA
jgi:3-hydroxyisobutyrate dehydrogenase/2-hydroxy-3-oxopropionate reductase